MSPGDSEERREDVWPCGTLLNVTLVSELSWEQLSIQVHPSGVGEWAPKFARCYMDPALRRDSCEDDNPQKARRAQNGSIV